MSDIVNYNEQTFESIKHINENGQEFWYARELQIALDYSQWRRFNETIERTKTACKKSGNDIDEHFAEVGKTIEMPKNAHKEIQDYELSRYACYLIVMNGDSRKEVIAVGQTYFAVKTRQESSGKKSNAEFLKWFEPIVTALKDLGGRANPKDARDRIATNLNLSKEEIHETRGKTQINKFANEVAFAKNYLAYEGIIDKSERGIWALTEKGMNCEMTEQYASDIFQKWVKIFKNRRDEKNPDEAEDSQVH
ncbi:MAG: winged helix-turn-helix domain-containing protein [Lachnospiraceae bacterium]